jgi:hypothetical protein
MVDEKAIIVYYCHRIGDVVCMKEDNSVEFIILDYI